MSFCTNCGGKIEEGVKFCSSCGNAVGGASVTPVVNTQVSVQIQSAMADEKYCFSCGSVIKKAAEICPKCGVNQNIRSSTTAIDVYCTSCGKIIKREAETCPFCGVMQEGNASKNKTTALLLIIFTGVGHRFYVGKIGSAILMLLLYVIGITLFYTVLIGELFYDGIPLLMSLYIGFIIWWIIDLVNIGAGKFKDKRGNPLKKN